MEPIGIDDVVGRERYGVCRGDVRQRIIAHKRARRVAVGDRLSLIFEDRATVWYQTQEMLWVERITDLDAIREELAVYNQLLPGPAEISATLLVEIADRAQVEEQLHRLIGIDEHVALEVDDAHVVCAQFEAGRQSAEKLSAVQYVRFGLGSEARTGIAQGAPVAVRVDHPHYRARTVVPEPVRRSLAADLEGPAAADAALRWVRDGG